MATAVQIQRSVPDQQFTSSPRLRKPRSRPQDKAWLFAAGSPREEARLLIVMMRRTGASIEDMRELIEVSLDQEIALRLYALGNPQDSAGIGRILQFRKRVAEEFERQL